MDDNVFSDNIISLGILREAKNLSNNNQIRTKPPDIYERFILIFLSIKSLEF